MKMTAPDLRHRAQRRLREQRIFTDELLDKLGEGVLAVDRAGTIAYVNAEALRLLHLGGGKLVVKLNQ